MTNTETDLTDAAIAHICDDLIERGIGILPQRTIGNLRLCAAELRGEVEDHDTP